MGVGVLAGDGVLALVLTKIRCGLGTSRCSHPAFKGTGAGRPLGVGHNDQRPRPCQLPWFPQARAQGWARLPAASLRSHLLGVLCSVWRCWPAFPLEALPVALDSLPLCILPSVCPSEAPPHVTARRWGPGGSVPHRAPPQHCRGDRPLCKPSVASTRTARTATSCSGPFLSPRDTP